MMVAVDVHCRTTRIWLGDDGIIRMESHPGAEEALKDAMENIAAGARLMDGKKGVALVDIRNIKSITKNAREYYSGPETAEVTKACAILVGSPLTKVIGNFYMRINKTIFPLRLFSSESSAISWLKGFI
ncbi:MAG: hypothetical protein OEY64_05820 [Nitrospinota bacterium]|nr:hypothetical protein [Nitrospinota bacterium]